MSTTCQFIIYSGGARSHSHSSFTSGCFNIARKKMQVCNKKLAFFYYNKIYRENEDISLKYSLKEVTREKYIFL